MYYGCNKEIKDKRDYKLKLSTTKSAHYPDEYEIKLNKIKDQGIVNSCVAHALASFLDETYKNDNLEFSTGFIYGYRPIGYSQEQGMFPRQAIKTLLKVGDCLQAEFNHNKEMPEIKKLVESNINNLKKSAARFKIQSYARIYTKNEILKCLYNDITVPISIPVYNDLDYNKTTNIINMPLGDCEGYHMVLLVGWNKNGYILQNSWGKYWGNGGKAILPFDYPIDTAWAIDTTNNAVSTYNTIWQKLYIVFIKFIDKLKGEK